MSDAIGDVVRMRLQKWGVRMAARQCGMDRQTLRDWSDDLPATNSS